MAAASVRRLAQDARPEAARWCGARRSRSRSRSRLRATVTSHPSGLSGMPASGQVAQRLLEGVGEGVLRERDVARRGGDEREQAAVRRPRGALGGRARVGGGVSSVVERRPRAVDEARRRSGGSRRRPSSPTAPCRAQAIAASRSSTSITNVPPSCSLVSANGPSWTQQLIAAAHRRRGRRRLQHLGRGEHAGRVERLRVLVELAHALGEGLGAEVVRGHLGVVEQECVSHGVHPSFCRSVTPL